MSSEGGKYLYAIIADAGEKDFGKIGIEGAKVFTITEGPVSAVVSDYSLPRIRPERRNIAAHQNVLKELMTSQTPLPLAFGNIGSGLKEVKKILSKNKTAFLEQLRRVDGKVEMGLRVSWDVPNIFEYFINTYPEMRATRDRLFGTHREPSQEDKIEVGRQFERLLQEAREEHTSQVEEVLAAACCEIKRNSTRDEREVMKLACLVGRKESQTTFEASVFEAAKLFDNNFSFDFNGPWAPHNFVDLVL
jgi:hypothetical protein